MAEAGFPGQHTTTTVTSSTSVQKSIRFDPSYVKTFPGLLKCVQVSCSLLGFVCILASKYRVLSAGAYFSWISMIAFWFTSILLGLYIFHIVEKFYKIPWLKIELVFTAVWTLLYMIAAILVGTADYDNAHIAATFFGSVATVAYALDAVLKLMAVRAGGLVQGSHVVSKQTISISPPREGY